MTDLNSLAEPGLVNVNLILPKSWYQSFCWHMAALNCVVAGALSVRNWTFGVEFINGDAKGLAIVVGPLWLGFAALHTRAGGE